MTVMMCRGCRSATKALKNDCFSTDGEESTAPQG
jgi:hypothetical protein